MLWRRSSRDHRGETVGAGVRQRPGVSDGPSPLQQQHQQAQLQRAGGDQFRGVSQQAAEEEGSPAGVENKNKTATAAATEAEECCF